MELMELLTTRRTYRRFDQSRPLPEEVVSDINESIRIASSARNAQELRFVAVTDPAKVEEIFPNTHFAGALPPELGTPKDGEHPVCYYAVLYDGTKNNPLMGTDSGLAISNMTLAAWNHGVGSVIMGAIDRKAIKEILKIEDPWEIHLMVAFGYPTHKSTMVDMKDGDVKYYLDDNKDYYVPKRTVKELVKRV